MSGPGTYGDERLVDDHSSEHQNMAPHVRERAPLSESRPEATAAASARIGPYQGHIQHQEGKHYLVAEARDCNHEQCNCLPDDERVAGSALTARRSE